MQSGTLNRISQLPRKGHLSALFNRPVVLLAFQTPKPLPLHVAYLLTKTPVPFELGIGNALALTEDAATELEIAIDELLRVELLKLEDEEVEVEELEELDSVVDEMLDEVVEGKTAQSPASL
jgi:hypothetical protein